MKQSAQEPCMGLCPGQSPVSAARRLQGLRKVAIDELGNVERDLQREASEDSELRERHRAAGGGPRRLPSTPSSWRRSLVSPARAACVAALPSACMGALARAGV